jgi:hypothetical protein
MDSRVDHRVRHLREMITSRVSHHKVSHLRDNLHKEKPLMHRLQTMVRIVRRKTLTRRAAMMTRKTQKTMTTKTKMQKHNKL